MSNVSGDLTPHAPQKRPLIWPDAVLDLQDMLLAMHGNTPLPPVYIVGGAVRDAYLHRPVKDLDLAVDGDAIGVARRITNALDGDIFVMDAEREVARVSVKTAQDGRITLDIARFRGADLLADLTERDFTVNAIAVDLLGDLNQLIDPLHGEADLDKKLIRRCAPHAIASDPIRALRAVRQSVQFSLRLDADTIRDCKQYAPQLMTTSPERVRDEFFNMLKLDRAHAALRVADTLGLLQPFLPEMKPLHGLKQPAPHIFDGWQHALVSVEKMSQMLQAMSYRRTDETAAAFDLGMMTMQLDRFRTHLNAHIGQAWPNERQHASVLKLMAFVHGVGKAPGNYNDYAAQSAQMLSVWADAMRLSSGEKKRLVVATAEHQRFVEQTDWPILEQHRFWYGLKEVGVDVILLGLASYLAMVGNELKQVDWLAIVERALALFVAYFDHYEQLVDPPLPINGNDLLEGLDLKRGPIIGQTLTHLRETVVVRHANNEPPLTPDEALAVARAFVEAALPGSQGS